MNRINIVAIAVSISIGISVVYLLLAAHSSSMLANPDPEQLIADCDGKLHCAVNSLMDVSEKEKEGTLLATAKELIKHGHSSSLCHAEGHHLGMVLYTHTGNLSQALSHAEPICGGSVYHGILESFFTEERAKNRNPTDINLTNICPEITGHPYAVERWECLHGLGHGLAILYNHDVVASIQRCDEHEAEWERTSCYAGIFMKYTDNLLNEAQTKGAMEDLFIDDEFAGETPRRDDFLFTCKLLDEKHAPQCYSYYASYIHSQFVFISESFKQCDRVVPKLLVKYCYFGMGEIIFAENVTPKFDMKASIDLCQKGQSRYHVDCFRGLVSDILDQMNTTESFEFCRLSPEDFKADCYDVIGLWTKMLYASGNDRAKECSAAESLHYAEVCMSANIESITLL